MSNALRDQVADLIDFTHCRASRRDADDDPWPGAAGDPDERSKDTELRTIRRERLGDRRQKDHMLRFDEITDEDAESYPTLEDLMQANEGIEDDCKASLGMPPSTDDDEEAPPLDEEDIPQDE